MKRISVFSYDIEFGKWYRLSNHKTRLGAIISGKRYKKLGYPSIYIGRGVSVFFNTDLVDLTPEGGKA
jgi:hypothetical protein